MGVQTQLKCEHSVCLSSERVALHVHTPILRERIQSIPTKLNTLTSSVLIFISLGSLVVCDAPHHAGLVANHLGFGCRVRLDWLPRFKDLFLGLYDLFFGLFGWGFGSRGLFVG